MRPSDLSMPAPTSFPLEAALSLQHAHRILKAMRDTHGSAWNPVTQSLICWIIDTQYISLMQVLGQLLDSVSGWIMIAPAFLTWNPVCLNNYALRRADNAS